MKRTIWDIFHREFEVRLSVSPRDTIAARETQWRGVSLMSSSGEELFPVTEETCVRTALDFLKEIRPQVLRFSADSPRLDRWLEFCSSEKIVPHICFLPEADREKVRELIDRCRTEFSGDEGQLRFYEVLCDPDKIPFEDDSAVEAQLQGVRQLGELIRSLDPGAKIIAGGIAPIGGMRMKAEIWNCGLLRDPAGWLDLIGIVPEPETVNGRAWDENAEGVEAAFSLAGQILSCLQRLERQIRETAPDSKVRIAVTGWHFLADDLPQKRQDGVYYSAVYQMLRKACARVALCEAGPLFGPGGMLRFEDGKIFGDVFYHHQLLTAADLPLCLEVKEPDFEKPVPVYRWEGIPGVLEGIEIKLVQVHASRSADGKQLYFLMTNLDPFKRCVLRIRFYDIPDLHPVKAFILKSKDRQDTVTPQSPENVFCKEVILGNSRRMNHVTIEIPECSAVNMLLE